MAIARPYCVSWSTGDGVAPRSVRDIQGGRGGTYSPHTIPTLYRSASRPTFIDTGGDREGLSFGWRKRTAASRQGRRLLPFFFLSYLSIPTGVVPTMFLHPRVLTLNV